MSAAKWITITAMLGAFAPSSLMLAQGEGKHLTTAVSASKWIVRAGQRTTLILDLELKPNVHVYAAGAQKYLPIEWKMKDSAVGTFEPPMYPKPQTLFLPAINETVPVHANRVRLTRDFVIFPDPKVKTLATGQFTIEGTLSYQACDDKMCYFPQELPLKWTLRFEAPEEKH